MAQIPDIPESLSWAWDEDVESSHPAVAAAGLRFASAAFFLAVLFLGFSAIGFFVPAKEGPVVGMAVGFCCVAVAVALAAWGFAQARSLIRLVDVYPSGVLWLERGDWEGARWEEIAEVVRSEVYVNNAVNKKVVSLTTRDGRVAKFQHVLRDWAKLADAVVMQTTFRLAPRALERFDAGKAVSFGPVSIDREGLEFGKKRLEYDELSGVTISNGSILFFTGKGRAAQCVSISELPNYVVFLKLLDVSPAPKPNR